MNTTKEIIAAFDLKRLKVEKDAEKIKRKVYETFPEYEEIEIEIKKLKSKLIRLNILHNIEKDEKKVEHEENILKKKIERLENEKKEVVKKNKINEESFIPKYNCKKCNDKGYITLEGRTKKCACLLQEIINKNFFDSNISQLEEKTFRNFSMKYFPEEGTEKSSSKEHMKKVIKFIESYIRNFNNDNKEEFNILFTGPTGVGKTHLSEAIARELINRGNTVWYQISSNFFSRLMDYKMNDIREYNNMLRMVNDVDLLIIDDLGAENLTESRKEEIFNILNNRVYSKKPIIISTNLNLKEIKDKYSERISSRIIGHCKVLQIKGKDIRLERKKKKIEES